jgi:PHD/YefM family antitoxin component YafN of YafNO toxin-antitoxin module
MTGLEWNTIRVTMTDLDRDYEYYLMLVEKDRKKVVITREGKDFAILIPHEDKDWKKEDD